MGKSALAGDGEEAPRRWRRWEDNWVIDTCLTEPIYFAYKNHGNINFRDLCGEIWEDQDGSPSDQEVQNGLLIKQINSTHKWLHPTFNK